MIKQLKEEFPHGAGFPIRLEHTEGLDKKTCWFQCQNHLDKYITRHHLDSKDLILDYQDPRMRPTVKPKAKTKSTVKTSPKKLFSSLEQFFDEPKTTMVSVGTSPRRKGTQKT